MAYVVTSACIDEETFQPECERVCAAGAVVRVAFLRVIDPRRCTDCGACEPVCPVGAIFREDRVPPTEQAYIAWNREESQGRDGA